MYRWREQICDTFLMMNLIVVSMLSFCVALAAGPRLSQQQVQAAILQGSMYKSADHFLESGLRGKGNRIKIDGVMTRDGLTKYVTFYNDWGAVVAASAAANQQMRRLKSEELELRGHLHAFVEVHGRGIVGAGKLDRRFGPGRAHLVLQLRDGRIIQPVEKQYLYRSGQTVTEHFLTGARSGRITLSFSFDVSPEELSNQVEVILIDGDGNKHQSKGELAGLLNYQEIK
jgi:hypothetical protein